jgi:fatty acid desaturase
MSDIKVWNPLTDWKHADIDWVKVDISQDDLRRFTQRNNWKGAFQTIGFLMILFATGSFAWWSLMGQHWILLVVALYFHGLVYAHFGDALHELSHGTVFSGKVLNTIAVSVYGWLYWPWNPHFYRISHQNYHHRYTLHQGSDGEDTPNYVEFSPRVVASLFFRVLHFKAMIQNLARLFTITPTSNGWRGRGYSLDTWEQFVLQRASEKDRRKVYRFAVFALVSHVAFVAACVGLGLSLVPGLWFLPVLITFAPFYHPSFHGAFCGVHQHTACEPNHPDFRVSCGTALLDPLSSFLYWHMEYHIEHHMFAAIPCYNLKAFRAFVSDQMPPMEPSLPRLRDLHRICKEKYGSWQYWRDHFGIYKGF